MWYFFQKKSVTSLYIYINIKKLVIYFEQCSKSPQMLNFKSLHENQNILQTHAVLSSISPKKHLSWSAVKNLQESES